MERPKLTIELSNYDKFLEIISLILLVSIWIFVIYNYSALPEIINTHFDLNGKPDGSGDKKFIFGLPTVATLLYTLLTVLNRFPHTFNYTVEITEENALDQYTRGTKILRSVKFVLLGVFGYASWQTTSNVNISPWFIPVMIVSLLTPIIYYNVKKSIK